MKQTIETIRAHTKSTALNEQERAQMRDLLMDYIQKKPIHTSADLPDLDVPQKKSLFKRLFSIFT